MYSEKKAKTLIKEFEYLKNKEYHPYGKEGRVFKITGIDIEEPKIKTYTAEFFALSQGKPNYEKEENAKLREGRNWAVKVTVSDKEDKMSIPLEDVLKKLRIKHDIDRMEN